MALKYHEIPIPIADSSTRYRLYYSKQYYCLPCPECLGILGQKYSVGVITVNTGNYNIDHVMLLDRFSYFCHKCPVMVVDIRLLESMHKEMIKHPGYISLEGLINLNLVPGIENVEMEKLLAYEESIQEYITPILPPRDNKKAPRIIEVDINKAFSFDFDSELTIPDQPVQPVFDRKQVHPPIETSEKKQAITLPKTLPGRNDPCFCGSGMKFKNCCYKLLP
jgi:hypothetical protein